MRNFLKTFCVVAVMISLCALQCPISAQVRRTTTTRSEDSSKEKSTQVRRTNQRDQVRRTGTTTSTTRSQVDRSGSDRQVRRTGTTQTNREQVRRTGTTTSTTRSQADRSGSDRQVRHPQGQNVRSGSNTTDGHVIRSNTNVTGGNGLGHYDDHSNSGSGYYHGDDFYIRDNRFKEDDYYDWRIREHNLYRIPPIERNFMRYERVSYFYGPDSHYFGWRVSTLPPKYSCVKYYGVEYYTYNHVYYRRYRGHYVVCRPPVGITIQTSIGHHHFVTVRFAFYPDRYRSYRGFDKYSRYIDRQNRIIAQNNALIASQNRMIALNTSSARSSYDIADALGLAQSYAYANREYFYQDGVFYIENRNGRLEVIVPPAGALVDRLPEDYDVIVLNGTEYYRVDDTIYRTVLVYGVPQLEVLGQMYGRMARHYSPYDRDDYDDDDYWEDDFFEDWDD